MRQRVRMMRHGSSGLMRKTSARAAIRRDALAGAAASVKNGFRAA